MRTSLVLPFLAVLSMSGQALKPAVPLWQPQNPLVRGLVRAYVVGSSPATVTDYSPSAANLACTGAALTPAFGGNELTGGSCTGSDAGMPSGNSAWSVAGFFQTATVVANGQTQVLFLWGVIAPNTGVVLAQYTTPLYCGTADTFAVTMLGPLYCGTQTINDNKPHRGAAVFDVVTLSIYIDGVLQSATANPTANVILMGQVGLSAGGGGAWVGSYGDLNVWTNRALSAEEVLSDFRDPWQAVRAPIIPCSIDGTQQQCAIEGAAIVKTPQGAPVIQVGGPGPTGPPGPMGPPGANGQPASGPLNLTCPLSPCIVIAAKNTQVAGILMPDPVTGTYPLSSTGAAVGAVTHVADMVTGMEIFPDAYQVLGGSLALNSPTGHGLYCVWWMMQ